MRPHIQLFSRSETPVSTATAGVGSSNLGALGAAGGPKRGKKGNKKPGPLGPVTGAKNPKLNYKCTGYWKEDHSHVRKVEVLLNFLTLITLGSYKKS